METRKFNAEIETQERFIEHLILDWMEEGEGDLLDGQDIRAEISKTLTNWTDEELAKHFWSEHGACGLRFDEVEIAFNQFRLTRPDKGINYAQG